LEVARLRNSEWPQPPEARYWNPPLFGGKPYSEPDHAFATEVIENHLFGAKDRTLSRIRQSEAGREFLSRDLPELWRQFLVLSRWMARHTNQKRRSIPLLQSVEASLAGVVSETMSFTLHGINAWSDSVFNDLPSRLTPDEQAVLEQLTKTPEKFKQTIYQNAGMLFFGPASLPANQHKLMLELVPGSAHAIKPGLLRAHLIPARGRQPASLKASWEVEGVDVDEALEIGSRCVGLSSLVGLTPRMQAITSSMRSLLPTTGDMVWFNKWGHRELRGVTLIDLGLVLALSRLDTLYPRLHRLAPWMTLP